MTTEIILISIDVLVSENEIPCDGCGECCEYGRICQYRKDPIIQAIKDLEMTPKGVNKARFVLKDEYTLKAIKSFDGSEFLNYENGLEFNFGDD